MATSRRILEGIPLATMTEEIVTIDLGDAATRKVDLVAASTDNHQVAVVLAIVIAAHVTPVGLAEATKSCK